MQATYEQLDIETIRYRTQHGLPITQEQQRWLVEQVDGKLEGKKTRCPLCEGEGRLYSPVLDADICNVIPWLDCGRCGGDGYILEQPKSASRPINALRERIEICLAYALRNRFHGEIEMTAWRIADIEELPELKSCNPYTMYKLPDGQVWVPDNMFGTGKPTCWMKSEEFWDRLEKELNLEYLWTKQAKSTE